MYLVPWYLFSAACVSPSFFGGGGGGSGGCDRCWWCWCGGVSVGVGVALQTRADVLTSGVSVATTLDHDGVSVDASLTTTTTINVATIYYYYYYYYYCSYYDFYYYTINAVVVAAVQGLFLLGFVFAAVRVGGQQRSRILLTGRFYLTVPTGRPKPAGHLLQILLNT